MRLKVSESIDPTIWDSMISSMEGSIFHSSIWANYITKAHPHAVPQFMTLLSNQGEVLGAALGFYQSSVRKLLKRFSGQLWLDAIPVVRADGAEESILEELLRQLEAYARSSGIIELSCGSFASPSGAAELQKSGFRLTKRFEFAIGLECSEDDLWNRMEYKRRKNIKKAIRMGVTIHDLPPKESVSLLRQLQADSNERIAARGGEIVSHQGEDADDPIRVLLDSGIGRIIGARFNGAFVSAGLFAHFNCIGYHTLSGHSRQALETQAPTLLLWETIKRYRKEGCKIFNLGGCKLEAINEASPEHGVYAYKKAFGATVWECASGQKTLRPVTKAITGVLKSGLISCLYRRVAVI